MDVQTIQMDPRIAAIHYKDYRKKVRAARAKRVEEAKKLITDGNKMRRTAYADLSQLEKEDVIAMESYRAMVKGARLINVATVLRETGLDHDTQLPNLALARAHWTHLTIKLDRPRIAFTSGGWLHWSYKMQRYTEPKLAIPFTWDLFGAELTNTEWRKQKDLPPTENNRAQVPSIPAHLRPDGDLSDYFILFEAKWEKSAPPDPLLLQHVAGHMYSVLAQWDLTDLEKAVLEGRFG